MEILQDTLNSQELVEKCKLINYVDSNGTARLLPSIDYLIGRRIKKIDQATLSVIREKAPLQSLHILMEAVTDTLFSDKHIRKEGFRFLPITRTKNHIISRSEHWYRGWHSVHIGEPVNLATYNKPVPLSVLKKINTFETTPIIKKSKLKKDFPFEYYVADVLSEPDPILFVRIGRMKELTFFLGNWE